MEMRPVVSSQIASIGWEDGTARVEFKSGSTYEYEGVPESVVDDIAGAASPGQQFAATLKYGYSYKRV